LYESSDKNIEFLFSNSITTIEDHTNHVSVSFQDGSRRKFDLLIGCDGIHSIVRKLIWGEEALFTHFLGAYFCILHFNTPLIKSDTVEMYNMPGKMSAIYCYGNNTDVMLAFLSEKISYDFRDVAAQKKIILRHFSGEGWRVPELLAAMEKTEVFYFDELCQVKMPNWSKGRVVLVGDAGYCATFATGMGTTLSLAGAATLADSLQKAGDDYKKAFEEYNTILQPFAEQTQAGVYEGLAFLIPKTGEEILTRNSRMKV